jgi:hypothetical protein
MIAGYIRKNKWSIGFLVCFVFSLSLYANTQYFFRTNPDAQRYFPPFKQGVVKIFNHHLGGEYLFIAQAIVDGKGFSNPFQVETGPTAWMPPLYPFVLALLIALFKKKVLLVCSVIFIKNIVLVTAGLLIYTIAKKTRYVLRAEIAVALYCLSLLTFFKWFFQLTHDEWLLLLLICILYPWAVHIRENRGRFLQSILWGCFGGICMLASPILGIVWGATAFVVMAFRQPLKYLIVSFVLCSAVCLPWMIRNYMVFDRLILMKSNIYFDIYTANYETEQGLFTEVSVVRMHPLWTIKNDPEAPYKVLGEMRFMDMYKEKFKKAFAADPGRWAACIAHRFVAAFIIYAPFCEHNPGVIEKPDALKIIVHLLPSLCLLLMLLAAKRNHAPCVLLAVFIYLLYLMPYVAVSYYTRYGIPLTAFKVLFIFWGMDTVIARIGAGRRMRSVSG